MKINQDVVFVTSLANRLVNLNDVNAATMAAFCLERGLMKPKGFGANMFFTAAKIGAKLYKQDLFLRLAFILSRPSSLSLTRDVVKQTAHWMINGKDQTDSLSVGGFNEQELKMIAEVCDRLEK